MKPNARRRIGTGLLSLICALPVFAQQYSFQYYGVDQGLTNFAVKSLFQDRRGFLWLSTEGGIFRYDGDRFQAYGPGDGIPVSNAAVFGEAPDGSLLVGGSFGLYRQVSSHFESVPLPGATRVNWGATIASGHDGRTYIASNTGLLLVSASRDRDQLGLGRLDIHSVPSPPHLGSSEAFGVLVEKSTVWWGCGDELCTATGDKTTVLGQSSGLPPASWHGIKRAGNGDLWLQNKSGGVALLQSGQTIFVKPDLPASRFGPRGLLTIDSKGRVIIPVGDGMAVQDGSHWKRIERAAGLQGPVDSVLQDREGSLWLGLSGHGLAKWRGYGEWEYFNTLSGLGSDLIFQVSPAADGSIWAGTDSGLFRGRNAAGNWIWQREAGPGDISIHSVLPDGQGRLWIGTEGRGAARLDTRTGRVEWFGREQGLMADSPSALMLDRENRIWAASLSGLYVADLSTLRFQPVSQIPSNPCLVVIQTRNGDIWAGTSTGLYQLSGGQWKRFTTSDGLSHNEVMSLIADASGDIWVGYKFGESIDRVRARGDSLAVTRMKNAPNDTTGSTTFFGIDAGGKIWAGTNKGVDVRDGESWRHYSQHDGLVWDDCALNGFATTPDGAVWIGTSAGLARFTPQKETPWIEPPTAVLTRLTLGDRAVDPDQYISVSHNAGALLARYSAPTFAREDSVIFRYRLAPLVREWRETRARELQFPVLPPDTYRLEVQARDGWGRWSTQSASFSFEVKPAWWRSWWFLSIAGVAFLGAVVLAVCVTGHAMRERERELVRLVDEQSKELREAHKQSMRFSRLDGLTGLSNRQVFDDTLQREWNRARRTGVALSLVMVDIDFFKRLNDALGHIAGDECLRLVAAELGRMARRDTDLVARYGGEEFAVILPGTDRAAAAALARSACLAVERLEIPHPDSPLSSAVTISMGIATEKKGPFPSVEALVAAADSALYAAKQQGKNRAVSFEPQDPAEILLRLDEAVAGSQKTVDAAR